MSTHESGQVSGSAAEIYESFFIPALFGEWPPRVLDAAGVAASDKVLDVACGTGVLTRAAALQVGSAGEVVGVDINDDMLAVARAHSPEITWKHAPAESLPFNADSFDRVVSQFGLMFFADAIQAIKEMNRVARPGGTVSVAVWASLAATPGYAAITGILRDLFGNDVAKSLEAPYTLGDPDQLSTLFKQAGIAAPHLETLAGTARFASIDAWIYTDIKGWTLADVLDDADYERLRQAAHVGLAQFESEDGSVSFDAPAHIVTFTV